MSSGSRDGRDPSGGPGESQVVRRRGRAWKECSRIDAAPSRSLGCSCTSDNLSVCEERLARRTAKY